MVFACQCVGDAPPVGVTVDDVSTDAHRKSGSGVRAGRFVCNISDRRSIGRIPAEPVATASLGGHYQYIARANVGSANRASARVVSSCP